MRVFMLSVTLCASCCFGCGDSSTNSGKTASRTMRTNGHSDEVPGPQTEPNLTTSSKSERDQPDATTADEVSVQVADRAGFDAVIAKHKGQVVLVDYWATWCAPCRKNFPHTVELSRHYKSQGLAVVSVAFDDEEDQAKVEQFLVGQQARFVNLRSQGGASDESFEAFDIPGGALPCLRLYDRSGKLRKTFAIDPDADKQFTFDDVEAAITELLAESPKNL
jgi:thiol-disulfide isomerase/thioredoxin